MQRLLTATEIAWRNVQERKITVPLVLAILFRSTEVIINVQGAWYSPNTTHNKLNNQTFRIIAWNLLHREIISYPPYGDTCFCLSVNGKIALFHSTHIYVVPQDFANLSRIHVLDFLWWRLGTTCILRFSRKETNPMPKFISVIFCVWILNYSRSASCALRIYYYHWVNTSAGGH